MTKQRRFSRFGCSAIPWTQEFWRAPVNLAQQIRACRGATSRIARKILTLPGGATLARSASQLYRVTRCQPGIPLPPDCRLEITTPQLARDLERIDDNPAAIGINRSNDYLDWRYARHPERANIRVLVLRRNDSSAVAGAFVFLEDRGPQRIAFIEDVVAPANCTDIHRTLLCAALRLAADNLADTLVTTTGQHDFRAIYWELGFRKQSTLRSRSRHSPRKRLQVNPNHPLTPWKSGTAGCSDSNTMSSSSAFARSSRSLSGCAATLNQPSHRRELAEIGQHIHEASSEYVDGCNHPPDTGARIHMVLLANRIFSRLRRRKAGVAVSLCPSLSNSMSLFMVGVKILRWR